MLYTEVSTKTRVNLQDSIKIQTCLNTSRFHPSEATGDSILLDSAVTWPSTQNLACVHPTALRQREWTSASGFIYHKKQPSFITSTWQVCCCFFSNLGKQRNICTGNLCEGLCKAHFPHRTLIIIMNAKGQNQQLLNIPKGRASHGRESMCRGLRRQRCTVKRRQSGTDDERLQILKLSFSSGLGKKKRPLWVRLTM